MNYICCLFILNFVFLNQKDMKQIKNYENYYSATKTGKIYSHKNNKYLKYGISTSGYNQVSLCKNGIPIKKDVHRIIAILLVFHFYQIQIINHVLIIKMG